VIEYADWAGTNAPAAPPASAAGGNDGQLVSVLRQQVQNLEKANLLKELQFATLTGLRRLLGGRMVGSFQQGSRIPETGLALVHRDERVVPEPEEATDPTAPIRASCRSYGSACAQLVCRSERRGGPATSDPEGRLRGETTNAARPQPDGAHKPIGT
jgi:hypothetical protein